MQKSAVLTGIGVAATADLSFSNIIQKDRETLTSRSTTYIASYDTESQSCVENLETIVNVHKKHKMPATFFVVANILNSRNNLMIKKLLDDPLFEVASHSYSHKVVLDHRVCGRAGDARKEIVDSRKMLEDIFGKEITGFRTPCGYPEGLKGEKQLLELVNEAGYKYISSMLWGPGFSLPAEIVKSFSYEKEGYKNIWEIPGHGWHENVLKGHSKIASLISWPNKWPDVAIPKDYIKTPNEEFEINSYFLNTAKKEKKEHITFIWHPWSLGRFDKEMKMLDLTFSYVKEQEFRISTFRDFHKILVG